MAWSSSSTGPPLAAARFSVPTRTMKNSSRLARAPPFGQEVRSRRQRERRERPWVTQGGRAGRREQLVERQPPDPSGVPRVPTAGSAPRQPHLEHGSRACQPSRRRAEEPYLAVCAAEKGAQDLPACFLAATAPYRQRE